LILGLHVILQPNYLVNNIAHLHPVNPNVLILEHLALNTSPGKILKKKKN